MILLDLRNEKNPRDLRERATASRAIKAFRSDQYLRGQGKVSDTTLRMKCGFDDLLEFPSLLGIE